ncbi:MAG: Slp family lipoprotein [Lysobacterales bacterium]|jgi:outer membrane lipoprotein
MRTLIILSFVLLLSACTTIPEQLQGTYADISPARVDPKDFGSTVRWGGEIIDSMNKPDSTCFEILSRDLDKYLRPEVEDSTAGRFIACDKGFHDPEVYAKGREVTVIGRIRNIEVRQIDDFNYRYPVLDVQQLVLWEKRQDVIYYDQYYDPFYYPYYWGYPYGVYYPYRPYPPHTGRARVHQTLPDPSNAGSGDRDRDRH